MLLTGVGALGALVLAGCGRSASGHSPPSSGGVGPSSTDPGPGGYAAELHAVALAAALENALVFGYDLALTGAHGSAPALAAFAQTVRAHHTEHAAAWNAVLTRAGQPAVTGRPLSNAQALLAPLRSAGSAAGVARAAVDLERAAAATYLSALGSMTDPDGLRAAATIAPIEAQHAAALLTLLGDDPAPASFLTTSGAIAASVLTA